MDAGRSTGVLSKSWWLLATPKLAGRLGHWLPFQHDFLPWCPFHQDSTSPCVKEGKAAMLSVSLVDC